MAVPDQSFVESLRGPRPTYSFEFFPPKDLAGEELLWKTLGELEDLKPTFISVTYGAGGSSQERSIRITGQICNRTAMHPVGHLTLVGQSRDELESVLKQYASAGVTDVLIIRGDPLGGPRAPWSTHPGGLTHAIELVDLARTIGGFRVGVGAFCEGHPDAETLEDDAQVLVNKAQAGAEYAITQLFFRASDYFALVDRVRQRACDIPIVPGIMPILNFQSISRMAELSGAAIPDDVVERIEPLRDDPAAVREMGIELATELCRDLLAGGAPGLHFITLNRSKATREIFETLRAEGLI